MCAKPIRDEYDVVIAGARVGGASTALLLARSGVRVLVVDPLPRGRDTLSTHALMRGGVMQLQRWGLLDAVRSAGTPVVDTTRFHYGDERIDIPIKKADAIDGLYAPRRTVLDPILVEAAELAGATVLHEVALTDLTVDRDGRVRGATIGGPHHAARSVEADLVVGADGLNSKVARLAGAPVVRSMSHAVAAIYGHWPGLEIDAYDWYFAPGLGAGAIPTNNGDTCVFASIPADRFRVTPHTQVRDVYNEVIRTLDPDLAAAVAGVREQVKLRAFAGVPGFLRQATGPGWALTGDAGFFRDPFTAHGITDALREAEFLARAIVSPVPGALDDYQAGRDARVTGILEVTDRISAFDWTMDEVKELHIELSRAMNVPVQAIRDIDLAGAHVPGPEPVAANAHGSRGTAEGELVA